VFYSGFMAEERKSRTISKYFLQRWGRTGRNQNRWTGAGTTFGPNP
jgi:hypothetical protein